MALLRNTCTDIFGNLISIASRVAKMAYHFLGEDMRGYIDIRFLSNQVRKPRMKPTAAGVTESSADREAAAAH
jgi:hypothetical protein